MKIDFYYWGNMCPLADESIRLLQRHDKEFNIRLYDFTNAPDIARREQIFFSFLTVVDEKKRYYSPISVSFLQELLAGNLPEESPYLPAIGTEKKCVEIRQITAAEYWLASQCTARTHCSGCEGKTRMYADLPDRLIGFMNVDSGKLLGGAEYYPSLRVPYNIPKGDDIAFITCVYLSDAQFDYKTAPLRALEQYLMQSFRRVIVISDEYGTFPNGNLEFFRRNGYCDDGIIFEDGYCRLHLLSKELHDL